MGTIKKFAGPLASGVLDPQYLDYVSKFRCFEWDVLHPPPPSREPLPPSTVLFNDGRALVGPWGRDFAVLFPHFFASFSSLYPGCLSEAFRVDFGTF